MAFGRDRPNEVKSLLLIVAAIGGWLALQIADETLYVSEAGERLDQPAVLGALLPVVLGFVVASWWYLARSVPPRTCSDPQQLRTITDRHVLGIFFAQVPASR